MQKCRKQRKKIKKTRCSIRATSSEGRGNKQALAGVFAQTIVLLFLLTFIIAVLYSFPMRITYLPEISFGIFLCFSPQWLEYIDAQPEMWPLFAASAISCFHHCLPEFFHNRSRVNWPYFAYRSISECILAWENRYKRHRCHNFTNEHNSRVARPNSVIFPLFAWLPRAFSLLLRHETPAVVVVDFPFICGVVKPRKYRL